MTTPTPADVERAMDWPIGGRWSFHDDPDPHKPAYAIMPGGAMLAFNHHARDGVDQARAAFVVEAANAALRLFATLTPEQRAAVKLAYSYATQLDAVGEGASSDQVRLIHLASALTCAEAKLTAAEAERDALKAELAAMHASKTWSDEANYIIQSASKILKQDGFGPNGIVERLTAELTAAEARIAELTKIQTALEFKVYRLCVHEWSTVDDVTGCHRCGYVPERDGQIEPDTGLATLTAERDAAVRRAEKDVPLLMNEAAAALTKMLLYATEYPKDSAVITAKELAAKLNWMANHIRSAQSLAASEETKS